MKKESFLVHICLLRVVHKAFKVWIAFPTLPPSETPGGHVVFPLPSSAVGLLLPMNHNLEGVSDGGMFFSFSPRLPAVQRRLRHRAHQGPTHPRPASAGARYLVHLIQRPLGKTARCKILRTKIKKTVPALRWIYSGGYFL